MQNPYQPFLGGVLSSGRLQLVDVVLLIIAPFGVCAIMRKRASALVSYHWPLAAVLLYLIAIFLAIEDYRTFGQYFEFSSALLLVFLFTLVLHVTSEQSALRTVLLFSLAGVCLVLLLSVTGLFVYYGFGWKWSYVLQENHVFPYLGDVVRLTGPFQPTAKLLSSYLTLVTPLIIAFGFLTQERRLRSVLLFIGCVSIVIYPWTLSRGVVGFSFALSFVLFYILRKQYRLYWIPVASFAAFFFLFLATLLASTVYVVDSKFAYSYDGDDTHTHSVYYYYHPKRGQEQVSARVSFARDHYYWLKKAALEIVKQHPNGVGNGGYSSAVKELEGEGIVPIGLSRHTTPQAEFFYAAAERGWFGVVSLAFLFLSWIVFLAPMRKNPVVAAAMGSLVALCFIDSLYLEITRFRFLWFFAAIFLAYARLVLAERQPREAQCV